MQPNASGLHFAVEFLATVVAYYFAEDKLCTMADLYSQALYFELLTSFKLQILLVCGFCFYTKNIFLCS